MIYTKDGGVILSTINIPNNHELLELQEIMYFKRLSKHHKQSHDRLKIMCKSVVKTKDIISTFPL